MSADKYDINQPILILVRRGRGGRGFLVSPVDSPTDVAACASTSEIGEVVLELLDDEGQPRINVADLLRASEGGDDDDDDDEDGPKSSSHPSTRSSVEDDDEDDDEDEGDDDDDDEDEEGEGEDENDRPWFDVRGAEDPADQILINVLHGVMGKAQKMSKTKGRRRRRRRGASKGKKAK